MAVEETNTIPISGEDAESLAKKLGAWAEELAPGEKAALVAALQKEVEGDDVQGYVLPLFPNPRGSGGETQAKCTCTYTGVTYILGYPVGPLRLPSAKCPVHRGT